MKVSSIFSQVLKLLSRGVRERGQAAQGRTTRAGLHQLGQFIAMLFCQVGRAHSLREICGGVRLVKSNSSIWECRWHPSGPPWPTRSK
jgi:hypothetical protein